MSKSPAGRASAASTPDKSQTKAVRRAITVSTEWLLLHVRMSEEEGFFHMSENEDPVWRQILVPSALKIDLLDTVLRAAYGWNGKYDPSFKVYRVKRCQLAGQGPPLVSPANPRGYTVPKYTLDEYPVHMLFENTWDMDEHRQYAQYGRNTIERQMMFAMARQTIPRKPKMTLERTTTLGSLNTQYKLSKNKHCLTGEYHRTNPWETWEHKIMVEKVIPAEDVRAWGIGDSWILEGGGYCPAMERGVGDSDSEMGESEMGGSDEDVFEAYSSEHDEDGHFNVQAANDRLLHLFQHPVERRDDRW